MTEPMSPQQTPPGWYPDAQGVVRWWDGQQWGQPAQQQYAPGPQVVVQAPYTMVTTSKKRTSHGLHLFLTIITFGLWGLLVWLPITIIHAFQKDKQTTRVG